MDLFGYAATLPDPPAKRAFDGASYEPDQDHGRLRKQLEGVRKIMADGKWHTLSELAEAIGCETQSASARVRDLRKPKYGSETIERKRIDGGLYGYRMVPK